MSDVTDIFWTGGWDSTFRIMELLTFTDRPIQPHYVVDPRRRSAPLEIETMQRLRSRFIASGLATPQKLRELRFYHRQNIPNDAAIEDAFSDLAQSGHIGNQYSWLARLTRAEGLSGIELSAEDPSLPLVRANMVKRGSGDCAYSVVPPGLGAISEVFAPFTFPLLDRSDQTLRRQAAERDWNGFLADTCFCHTPLWGREPCGTCRPCILMLERKGESARVGLIGKARYWTIERLIRALPSALEWRCRQWQENHAVRKLHEQ